jgi:hypothetical protein
MGKSNFRTIRGENWFCSARGEVGMGFKNFSLWRGVRVKDLSYVYRWQKNVSEFFTVKVRSMCTVSRPDPESAKEYALRIFTSICGWGMLRCASPLGAPLRQRSSFSAFHHKSEILHDSQAGQIFGCFIVTAILCWPCGSACGIDQGLKNLHNLPTSPSCLCHLIK